MGERAPLWNDEARGVFFGLSRNHKREHMIRAVFESAGFTLLNILKEIEKFTVDEVPENLIKEEIVSLKEKKEQTQPLRLKTSGSTFKNPVGQSNKKVWA